MSTIFRGAAFDRASRLASYATIKFQPTVSYLSEIYRAMPIDFASESTTPAQDFAYRSLHFTLLQTDNCEQLRMNRQPSRTAGSAYYITSSSTLNQRIIVLEGLKQSLGEEGALPIEAKAQIETIEGAVMADLLTFEEPPIDPDFQELALLFLPARSFKGPIEPYFYVDRVSGALLLDPATIREVKIAIIDLQIQFVKDLYRTRRPENLAFRMDVYADRLAGCAIMRFFDAVRGNGMPQRSRFADSERRKW